MGLMTPDPDGVGRRSRNTVSRTAAGARGRGRAHLCSWLDCCETGASSGIVVSAIQGVTVNRGRARASRMKLSAHPGAGVDPLSCELGEPEPNRVVRRSRRKTWRHDAPPDCDPTCFPRDLAEALESQIG
jgi:hypothetical protein